ncbi:acyltransferase [Mesorhizobium sp. BAC0120]|uniref:acyltransferase family protein n=1 Tax=Mesorhizobium sp. BAC0120 TaxID=3090670 RepID=UPI00298C330F|nr:acyltransferase [Mesorhizobium sp. BAC0120]MDW6022601.1 acyltransferase [Mesorhizobium sp. BAC0120]
MKKLYGIQYLRACAALAVVAFHAAERTGGHFAIGAAGVDVFFVVSGFIMWVISETRRTTPAQFLRERVQRIVPIYWAATGVMIVGALAGLFPNLKLTLAHVLESLFFVPHRSPSNGEIWPILIQGWTLNYEMFFYVIFAGALFLPPKARLAALTATFILLVASGLLVDGGNDVVLTYTDPIILEFLLGALIAKLWLAGRMPQPMTGLGLIAVALLGFAIVGTTHIGFGPLVFGPLAAALVVGTLALEKAGAFGRIAPLTYLGDSSYSIYLWHTLAISVVAKLAGFVSMPFLPWLVIALLAGTAIGVFCYEFLEKPLTAAFKRGRRRSERLDPAVPAGDTGPQL